MNELVKILLSLSLSGTLLIFALLLCKPLYKNKLSRQWQYYIWLVVVARLLLPLTTEVSLVGSLFQSMDTVPNTEPIKQVPFDNQNNVITDESTKLQKPFLQRVFEMSVQNIWLICGLVWLIGAVGLLIRKITVYQSFVKYVRATCVEVSDMRLWEVLGKQVEQMGIKTTVELYTNGLISSPLLIGFFHPYIILPSADLLDSDLENTILHELTHYKRRDMFYKWLIQITICLHWFNPFVHFMGKEIGRACEFSCDEVAIRELDIQRQQSYGDTLLNAIKIGSNYNDSIVSVTFGENAEQIKERLDIIMRFKKTTRLTATISVALVFVLCFGATAVGAYTTIPSENKAIQLGQQAKTNNRVIHEGGVYYILCDGADESNKPTSGVTKGSIMFVLVRKDSYTSISGFSNLEKLVNEVTEQCDYMLRKKSITQDEAKLIIQVANKIQSGNNSDFIDQKVEISYKREYAEWGIVKKNGAYYYNNERVRIFMDLRANNSFVTFNYDKLGTINLRLVRVQDGSIKKVEYLTKAKADEILKDLDIAQSNDGVSRLTKEMVPKEVLNTINSCDDGIWYVIADTKYQYIYYNSVPHNYAWQPYIDKDSANISIFDIGKSTGTYVLLAVPNNLKLKVSYNSKQVTLKKFTQKINKKL